MKLANEFLMGCDPEFVVEKNGAGIRLDNLLPHQGPVGYDHNGAVGEFRPEPAKGTWALVKRIAQLMKSVEFKEKFKEHQLKAGAVGMVQARRVTLGGHVHIGLNPYMSQKEDLELRVGQVTAHASRVKALDQVTKYLEELDLLPKVSSAERRKTQYGRLGDVRIQRNKNSEDYHTEYRAMCSWLFDPKVAYLCLTAAKLACVDPQVAIGMLKSASASERGLKEFYRVFSEKDTNAKRAVNWALEDGIGPLQGHEGEDFFPRWREM